MYQQSRLQLQAPVPPADPSLGHYGSAVADLTARAIHCCYGGHWASRLGGVSALECLVPRLAPSTLPRLAPTAAKAVFAVLRILPEHAAEEKHLGSVLQAILMRCGGGDSPFDVPGTAQQAVAGSRDTGGGASSPPVVPASLSSSTDGKPDAQQLPPLFKQIMEIFVQQLLSSRSSSAVRAAASAGLEVQHCCHLFLELNVWRFVGMLATHFWAAVAAGYAGDCGHAQHHSGGVVEAHHEGF